MITSSTVLLFIVGSALSFEVLTSSESVESLTYVDADPLLQGQHVREAGFGHPGVNRSDGPARKDGTALPPERTMLAVGTDGVISNEVNSPSTSEKQDVVVSNDGIISKLGHSAQEQEHQTQANGTAMSTISRSLIQRSNHSSHSRTKARNHHANAHHEQANVHAKLVSGPDAAENRNVQKTPAGGAMTAMLFLLAFGVTLLSFVAGILGVRYMRERRAFSETTHLTYHSDGSVAI